MTTRERLISLAQWLAGGTAVGLLSGLASALFLWLLDRATLLRMHHEVLVYGLPAAGLVMGWAFGRFGTSIKGGASLVIDRLHEGGPEIPVRMAPMVLAGTVLTHLFGGSAGREGTAVQMGASLADFFSHRLRLSARLRRDLLAAGVAGGFGSVFGTPIAGAVFGLEFVVLGRIEYRALVPALVAAVVGDMTTRGVGIVHTAYPSAPTVALTAVLLAKWLVFAAAVAGTTTAFIELVSRLKRLAERFVPNAALRMALGGAVLVVMWRGSGTSDFLGLGIPTIVRAFDDPTLASFTFAAKLLFTAVTLAAGFLGGEVTPLFFVGAALGNLMAGVLGIPLPLGAAVGMAGVFAAASNTPLALSIMAVELVGGGALPHVGIVCVLAYLMTGHRSIYPAQRLVGGKAGRDSIGNAP